ncbi:MAG: hypothetical protein KDK08_15930 [Rhizobiaceae bacterium]|nr:hypothetical protein [Rhizobiaceae bacterium]
MKLILQERGSSVVVSLDEWRSHSLDQPMKALASKNVLRIARSNSGFVVTPGNYVGELLLPSASVTIEPKSPSVLAAMDSLALRSKEKHLENLKSEGVPDGSTEGDPAGEFRDALLDCVYEGIPWQYVRETHTTSFPRGRIEFGKTVRQISARGIRHRVIATRPVHRQDQQFNRVVQSVIPILPTLVGVTARTLREVHTLSQSLDVAEPFGTSEEAIRAAHDAIQNLSIVSNTAAVRLLKCCIQILTTGHLFAGWVAHVPNGIARFRNIEALWERCVQVLVDAWLQDSAVQADARLHGLRGSEARLFPDGGPLLDPDVTIEAEGRTIGAVDAKYKLLDPMSSGASTDLYQLTCYVRSLNAGLGILVHLTERDEYAKVVGTTLEGAPIVIVTISDKLLLQERACALSSLLARWPIVRERLDQSFAHCLAETRRNRVADLFGNVLLRT